MDVKCAVVGYGPSFNMGKTHCKFIDDTRGLELVAICDMDRERLKAAKDEFPSIDAYENLDNMLKEEVIDLVTIVTPHNTHAYLTIKCLKAGRHVIVEKPMCITTNEATAMIEEAKMRNLMLSVFHNRRFDGKFLRLKEIVDRGQIGNVFHAEVFMGSYSRPGSWWRSDKKISGGALYDLGAHCIDWVLNLFPGIISGVTGFFHKNVWKNVTNADQAEAIIRFESGAVADVQISKVASIHKPVWRVLGTKGGLVSMPNLPNEPREQSFKVVEYKNGKTIETKLEYKKSNWQTYYQNIAAHLLQGTELKVKPEEGRRVIAVIEAAEKSSRLGKTIDPAYH